MVGSEKDQTWHQKLVKPNLTIRRDYMRAMSILGDSTVLAG